MLFNYEGVIKKYSSEEEIMREFYVLRENLYEKRKEYLLLKMKKEVETISNKVRFILGVIKGEIKVSNQKRAVVVATLKQMGFKTWTEINAILPEKKRLTVISEEENKENEVNNSRVDEEEKDGIVPAKEYDYLLSMPIWNLTEEKVEELKRQLREKEINYDELEKMSIHFIWKNDLDTFLAILKEHED